MPWWQAQSNLRKLRARGQITKVFSPEGVSSTEVEEAFQDIIAWCMHWAEPRHEFTQMLHWQADFLRYLFGYVTQEEEQWFHTQANYICGQQEARDQFYMVVSKTMVGKLRHNKGVGFDQRGAMEISELFQKMSWASPFSNQYWMNGRMFAAFLHGNPKGRFRVDVRLRDSWYPYRVPCENPWEIRIAATQGHSNQEVQDPYSVHHPLTYDEASSLGWIFHVTDEKNAWSIDRSGLLMKADDKGTGRGGRDAVHFMYENDGSPGYIAKGPGTVFPRAYRNQAFYVLLPSFFDVAQVFLTSNGVVLVHENVPPQYLKKYDQFPSLALNVLHPGRGHQLPSSVTGGTWATNTTYEHVVREKGSNFIPGGEVPSTIRNTAWEFMGQQVPDNYGRLVFGTPLPLKENFDPAAESIHGLIAEISSDESEAPPADVEGSAENFDPAAESIHGLIAEISSDESEAPPADVEGSAKAEEPGASSAAAEEAHPPPAGSTQVEEARTFWVDYDEDQEMEVAAEQWAIEEEEPDEDEVPREDPLITAATTSFSSTNPWVLYDANVFCTKDENGVVTRTNVGEKTIILREWRGLLTNQRIALRRQGITRPEWECLPWTGHLCFIFVRAWELGRYRSFLMRRGRYNDAAVFLEGMRDNHSDWLRDLPAPVGYEDRHEIDPTLWSENFRMYRRDELIQQDLEWLMEA
eukprot:s3538_g6.t1